jgi:hypothetical protein
MTSSLTLYLNEMCNWQAIISFFFFQETILPSKHVTNSVSETHTKGVYDKNKIKGFER